MTPLQALLAAIHATPGDDLAWMALADWLEEDGQADRAELLRLSRRLFGLGREDNHRRRVEARIQALLASGARPCVPDRTNSIGLRLALVSAGRFWMGSPEDEDRRHEDELPHEITISRPFYLGTCQVTQRQYAEVMGINPSSFQAGGGDGDAVSGLDTRDFPVESVSWHDAVLFCERLGRREGRAYRLPTEAEWEYACRAGTTTPFHCGRSLCSRQANFDGDAPFGTTEQGPDLARPCPVGSYPPNAWGIHDMHGNLDEWCQDWYEEDYYRRSPRTDPRGPAEGEMRVMRGGTWGNSGRFCRAAFRWRASPEVRQHEKGFRVVLIHGG